jgi:HEAT repeat protein
MPLEQGLRHLLQGFDSFFLYGVQGSGAQARTALQGIWIYAPGQGQRLAPLPPEHWASSQELATGLHDPEEAERARTVELLVERQGTRALDEVLVALEDGDNQVRERALHAALYAGIQLPLPRLAELAQYDPSPLVRFLALGAMVEETITADNASVVRIVEQALDDPSPEIREQAWQIIQQWENPAAPFEEEEQQGEAESAEGVSR